MKKNSDVPLDIAAKALFLSDRTCCVCRTKGKSVQIHHIDGDNQNHKLNNLAILCLDCHNDTLVSGGFHRKLDADQIILYRDDWHLLVTRERVLIFSEIGSKQDDSEFRIQLATTQLEQLRESKEYELLAIDYHYLGNAELRDKYIQLALEQETDEETEIFLRHLQDKMELVDSKIIERQIKCLASSEDWSGLARLYTDIEDWDNAIKYYCRSICEDLQEGNIFSAAFYLKELSEHRPYDALLQRAYRQFSEQKDIWWQVRSLQELGWDTELNNLLVKNRAEIEKSNDPLLLRLLYEATGEKEKLLEITKNLQMHW